VPSATVTAAQGAIDDDDGGDASIATGPVDDLMVTNLRERFRYQTLMALVLSAQTRDQCTAAAVRRLQAALPGGVWTASSVSAASEARVLELIQGVCFQNNKARYLKAAAAAILEGDSWAAGSNPSGMGSPAGSLMSPSASSVPLPPSSAETASSAALLRQSSGSDAAADAAKAPSRSGSKRRYTWPPGTVPTDFAALCALPGVGPKVAHIFKECADNEVTGIGVDVHVNRTVQRWGWTGDLATQSQQPEATRKDLESFLPPPLWREINEVLVGFGQVVCRPIGPLCHVCPARNICPSSRAKNGDVASQQQRDGANAAATEGEGKTPAAGKVAAAAAVTKATSATVAARASAAGRKTKAAKDAEAAAMQRAQAAMAAVNAAAAVICDDERVTPIAISDDDVPETAQSAPQAAVSETPPIDEGQEVGSLSSEAQLALVVDGRVRTTLGKLCAEHGAPRSERIFFLGVESKSGEIGTVGARVATQWKQTAQAVMLAPHQHP
jgi:endonuclease III